MSGGGRTGRILILGGLLTSLSLGLAGLHAEAYYHHISKIKYQEYSQEAFDRAKREGKPIFMLVSAIWCYWCKYFKQHALETDEVADYLNQHYVSVFVDSDRRIDLTRRYVRGWPMTVLFDPEGRVRQSFPGALRQKDFLWVLKRVRREITEGPYDSVVARAQGDTGRGRTPLSAETYRRFVEGLAVYVDENFDDTYGGFGTREKYPNGTLLAFLLERYERAGDRRALEVVLKTLDGILKGLHDPIEGGFFRYAERRQWRVPHYEKMTHVNTSLLVPYLKAYVVTRRQKYRDAAELTISYLEDNLYDHGHGGFYGSQTADHAYYRLNREQRKTSIKPPIDSNKYTARNSEAIVSLLSVAEMTGQQNLKDIALRSLEFMREKLLTDKGMYHFYDVRAGSGHLLGQLHANAWAAYAFIRGHQVSGKETYRRAANQVLDYALAELYDDRRWSFIEWNNPDGRLLRKHERRSTEIPLDANGIMAEALLGAHRAGGPSQYLKVAERLLGALGGRVVALLTDEPDESDGTVVASLVDYLRAYEALVAGDQPTPVSQGNGAKGRSLH